MSSPVPVQSDMITLGDIIHAVWQRKWLCISIVSVFFLVGLVVSIIKSPKYTFSQTLVNASVPTGSWDNDPRAMRDGSVFANYLERHNDKVMQRNDDALDMKIGVAKPGSLSVTLKTEAPESRVNEVRSRLDDALKILNDYQQPWLAITHQSLVRSVDLDQQAISDLQQRQRDLARSTKLVVTHSMPSPDAILSAAHSSGPSAPPRAAGYRGKAVAEARRPRRSRSSPRRASAPPPSPGCAARPRRPSATRRPSRRPRACRSAPSRRMCGPTCSPTGR